MVLLLYSSSIYRIRVVRSGEIFYLVPLARHLEQFFLKNDKSTRLGLLEGWKYGAVGTFEVIVVGVNYHFRMQSQMAI